MCGILIQFLCSGIEVVITGLTRNRVGLISARSRKRWYHWLCGFSTFLLCASSTLFLHFCAHNFQIILRKIEYGDVPKRLKGPHSKCGRRLNSAREFESLHLRHNRQQASAVGFSISVERFSPF